LCPSYRAANGLWKLCVRPGDAAGKRRLKYHLAGRNKYEPIIFWSDEDGAFVADVPELAGCMAHGTSHADALGDAEEAIALWVETARELGRTVPQPKGRRLVFA
jgi:predicted RNase H-like HicB family nuclease